MREVIDPKLYWTGFSLILTWLVANYIYENRLKVAKALRLSALRLPGGLTGFLHEHPWVALGLYFAALASFLVLWLSVFADLVGENEPSWVKIVPAMVFLFSFRIVGPWFDKRLREIKERRVKKRQGE